jgi:hypothetical protein
MSNVTGMLAGVGLLSVCCISSSVAAGMMGGGEETPEDPTTTTPTGPSLPKGRMFVSHSTKVPHLNIS